MTSEIYDNTTSLEKFYSFKGRSSYLMSADLGLTPGVIFQVNFNAFNAGSLQLPTGLVSINGSGSLVFSVAGNYSISVQLVIQTPATTAQNAILNSYLQLVAPSDAYDGFNLDKQERIVPPLAAGVTLSNTLKTVGFFAAGQSLKIQIQNNSLIGGFTLLSSLSSLVISKIS